jgi:hypothetical protein
LGFGAFFNRKLANAKKSKQEDWVNNFGIYFNNWSPLKLKINYRTYALYKLTMMCMNENRSFQTFGD